MGGGLKELIFAMRFQFKKRMFAVSVAKRLSESITSATDAVQGWMEKGKTMAKNDFQEKQRQRDRKFFNAGMNFGLQLATFLYTATRSCSSHECTNCPIGAANCPVLLHWLRQPEEA